jgi:phage terminase large subunit-like protein
MSAAADFGAELRLIGRSIGDDPAKWRRFLALPPPPVLRRLKEEFFWQAHGGQKEPEACADGRPWRVWLLMAGRGFGKTRAGAEWVSARARENPGAQIALVGATESDVARVMVEGPSGILAVARSDEAPRWAPTRGIVHFPSGATGFVYSAGAAGKLRGPEHHFAWADELGKWPETGRRHRGAGEDAWDNLMMGMRIGAWPRIVVTTTPKANALVRRVKALDGIVTTGGATDENVHLSGAFVAWVKETYGGTRLGRQELDGILFEDAEGALWTRETIERARDLERLDRDYLVRVVVGVDPPASQDGACGIVVCGLGEDGIAYVLADCSVAGERPEGWARKVAKAAEAWEADRVIAEKNQGGDMVESVIRAVDAELPVRLVSATSGKSARAEPVAARFETGRARIAGRFSELEDEMAGMLAGGGYSGPGRSPDRADAMVWAMNELARPQRVPRVRAL